MSVLLIYHSHTGRTARLAERIAAKTGAELARLEPVHPLPRSGPLLYLLGTLQTLFHWTPKLAASRQLRSQEHYDTLVIGAPVWNREISPPLRSYLEHQLVANSRVFIFVTHRGEGAERALDQMASLLPHQDLAGRYTFAQNTAEDDEALQRFCDEIAISPADIKAREDSAEAKAEAQAKAVRIVTAPFDIES